ncbi:PREDICTED: uncharacterized protein LOC105556255 [Vollenhovia emeryi]|uniref:uncharacterized protein LOC105556255 n=1 Tax=Vollenhovia emeryi TaxID=411798 RepID=UPI0005F42F04|nr:PREDICTED: uncharacterized protein LOC105556255 [Vollenhovia emeryi]
MRPKAPTDKGNALQQEKRNAPEKKKTQSVRGSQRNPRTQAVTLTFPQGTYGEGMRLIKSHINLKELGIDALKPRRAQTGAIILEVTGENAKEKADCLAEKMRAVVGGKEGVKITRPTKLAEIRIRDLDDSITVEDVKEAVAKAGGCTPPEVKTGEIKLAPNGLGTIWVQCPLVSAKRAAAPGKVKIGWIIARLELLEARPLICFRCLERGHVRAQCRSRTDRSEVCCRCGATGHKAQECSAEPKCPVCTARGLPANHKAGNKACPMPSRKALKKRRREEGQQQAEPSTPRNQAVGQPANPEEMEVDTPAMETDTPAPLEQTAQNYSNSGLHTTRGEGPGGGQHGIAFMPLRIIQANINHARQAQDLLLQAMAERGGGLAIVAEPWRVPNHPCWAVNQENSVAIHWRRTREQHIPCCKKGEGPGWAMVEWDPLTIIGVYLRPSLSRAELEERLEDLEQQVRAVLPRPILVAGDFNAKSALWGSRRPDAKGAEVEAWADRLGLHLMNTGTTSTCVRPQGESIVDITWISPAATRIVTAWRVAEDIVLLSDHLPLEMEIRLAPVGGVGPEDGRPLRWSIKKMDPDKLQASLAAETWVARAPVMQEGNIENERSHPGKKKGSKGETENRRRPRKPGDSPGTMEGEEGTAEESDPEGKREGLGGIDQQLEEDPWGRPYKLVLDKLSRGAPPTVETLEPAFLERVVHTLFPAAGNNDPAPTSGEDILANDEEVEEEWQDDLEVSDLEITKAVKRLKAGKAPGPDGIPGIAWKTAMREIAKRLGEVMNACLRMGYFPQLWKEAKMVLLPKEGKPAELPSSYRPICLLDEAGKVFERVITSRLVRSLEDGEGEGLHVRQYGFREARSTVDAIITIGQYLENRTITCTDKNAAQRRWNAESGVPQGSVLGPVLWDVAYDEVLRTALPSGCTMICYADDTLVLAGGRDWKDAVDTANIATACAVRAIKALGLKVAAKKTEATFMHDGSHGPPPAAHLVVDDTRVDVGTQIKYLGLHIDARWKFEGHILKLTHRLGMVANSLSRLMPNLGVVGGSGNCTPAWYILSCCTSLLYGSRQCGETGRPRRPCCRPNERWRSPDNREDKEVHQPPGEGAHEGEMEDSALEAGHCRPKDSPGHTPEPRCLARPSMRQGIL